MDKEITLISKLDSFMENALYDIQLDALLEDAQPDESFENKVKLSEKIKAFWNAFIALCKRIGHWIKVKIKRFFNFISGKRNYFISDKSFEVTEYIFIKCPNIPIYNDTDNTDIFDFIYKMQSKRKRIEKGSRVDIRNVNAAMNAFAKNVDIAEKRAEKVSKADIQDPKELDYYRKMSKFFKEYMIDARTLTLAAITYFSENNMSMKPAMKYSNKSNDIIKHNSYINDSAIMRNISSVQESSGNNLLRAQLLIEAAELLNEYDEFLD